MSDPQPVNPTPSGAPETVLDLKPAPIIEGLAGPASEQNDGGRPSWPVVGPRRPDPAWRDTIRDHLNP
ncbi:MAG: hypothetical protein GY929_12680 [Actinomycetia bacterium]|nr:hypothetical protein [Actinomycetes bacterium]